MSSFKNYLRLLSVMSLFVLFSCQSEIAEQQYNTQETILKTTPLTTYVERIAMQSTSQDNLVDNTDCFMVKFPYVITINNVEITINSKADYLLVEKAKNLSVLDNDIVYFHFPMTVILNDYNERIIQNQTDFNNLLHDCEAHLNDFFKINCLEFIFPITINIYDSAKQIASSVKISDNKSLYNFISNLKENQFIAFAYPLIIKNENGQSVTINDNTQLENSIEQALDHCYDNKNTSLDFMGTITNGFWKISYFYDDFEKTALYNGYVFVFKNDQSVIATKSGITLIGHWETRINNGVREFKISFNSDLLHGLDKGWKLFEFNTAQIRFKGETSNSGMETDYLFFTKVN